MLIVRQKLFATIPAQQVLITILFLAVFYYLAALAVRTVYLDENLAHSISLNASLPLFYPFILFLPQPHF